MSILHHQEEKDMTKVFHVKIQVKKTKTYVMFNFGSQDNIIVENMASKLQLEVQYHPIPYPLCWVNKDPKIKVTK